MESRGSGLAIVFDARYEHRDMKVTSEAAGQESLGTSSMSSITPATAHG